MRLLRSGAFEAAEAGDGLPSDHAHRHYDQQRRKERRENRCLLQSIRPVDGWTRPSEEHTEPGESETQDVGQVVTGVRNERERVLCDSDDRLDQCVDQVDGDSEREPSVGTRTIGVHVHGDLANVRSFQ